jgi:hypothetical protein
MPIRRVDIVVLMFGCSDDWTLVTTEGHSFVPITWLEQFTSFGFAISADRVCPTSN